MNLNIFGKVALITGGSHGIGKSIALSLAEEGCNVTICARNKDRIDNTIEEIESIISNKETNKENNNKIKTLGIVADVTIPKDIDNVIKSTIDKFGTINILINNVGGGGRWGNENVETTDEKVWLDVYNKNALAAIRFTIGCIQYMKKQNWGRVITISSIYGKESGGRPWFNMSKSAEISLMKTLAKNNALVRKGITFNTIAPGSILIPDTGWDMERIENPNKFNEKIDLLPFGRLGTPEEVANVVTFLCSDKASLINGSCITVDGGESFSF